MLRTDAAERYGGKRREQHRCSAADGGAAAVEPNNISAPAASPVGAPAPTATSGCGRRTRCSATWACADGPDGRARPSDHRQSRHRGPDVYRTPRRSSRPFGIALPGPVAR